MTPSIAFPDTTAILPPRFLGPVGWYAAMARYGRAVVDTSTPFDKRQKSVHRCEIADTRGRMTLTVPLCKPSVPFRQATWRDCAVSTHDEWWIRACISLESAYGRTPFFEFLVDRFLPLFVSPADSDVAPSAIDLDIRADEAVRSVLNLPTTVEWGDPADLIDPSDNVADLRRADFTMHGQRPYWQVRQERLGFLSNLSAADLVFNLGPEATLYLLECGRGLSL